MSVERNLVVRVATALILGPVVLWLLWIGGLPFALLVSFAAAACAWELNELAETQPRRDGPGAARAYGLLCAAMEDRQRVGVGSVVMRNKQYLAAIRPLEGVLAMSTLRFADEVVARSEVDGLPARRARPDAKELRLATQIIDALEAPWKPAKYHDTYTEELRQLIERRAKGETVAIEDSAPKTAEVLDLMEALNASVAAAKRRRRGGPAKKKASPHKRSAATKTAARKSA